MGAYHYVDPSRLQSIRHLLGLFCRTSAREIVHVDREVAQPLLERLVVLIGQYRSRHKHGRLLAVATRLESGTHGELGLSEAHVTADKTIHGHGTFHVGLDVLRSLQLVGRVFIEETRLKLMLHEIVWRKREALLMTALGVKANKVTGNVLDFLLCPFLEPIPRPCAQSGKARWLTTVGSPVFRDFIQ